MDSYAYYNGKFGKKDEITIPLSDRSIYFGDAVYDAAIGSYDRILWEDEHLTRFLSNAERIGINHPYSKKYLSSLIREIAVKSMIEDYFLYMQLSRSSKDRVHSAVGTASSLLIIISPFLLTDVNIPLRLMTTEDMRYGYCDIKTVNLLPAVLVSTEAENKGFDEAVFIKNGIVTECAKSNISIIKQGRVISHPENNRILPGITREKLRESCLSLGIDFCECEFTKEEMMNADEIIVSSTSKLCRRVSEIDGTKVGGKNMELSQVICDDIYKKYIVFCKI